MQRRRFLKLSSIAFAGLACESGLVAAQFGTGKLTFHVAGTQFMDFDLATLRRGDQISVRRSSFRGETCFVIQDLKGRQIGFIPKALVFELQDERLWDASISLVNLHAIPWKRVAVTLSFG